MIQEKHKVMPLLKISFGHEYKLADDMTKVFKPPQLIEVKWKVFNQKRRVYEREK